MEHVGDWLYYVIFFGIAIVSLINSVAKKKPVETVSPPPVYESPAPPPAPLSVRRKTPPPTPKRSKSSDRYDALFQKEGQRVFENEATTDNEITTTDNWSLNDAETMRKAIIYTEILNRKY